MKYRLKVYYIWEYGQRKDSLGNPHQEDSIFPMPKELKDSDRTFILCDGMGGHDAGEVASETVCQAMGNYILNDGHDAQGIFTDNDLTGAIAAAFDALDKKDSGAEKKMGTTMTFLKLHNTGATIAHMGDSRVYHIRPGADGDSTRILFRTEDHSLVNDLIRIGELTPEEARKSKQRNVITRAMQPNMGRRPRADIKHITDIRPGDFFYMCSDGMLEQPDMDDGTSLRNVFSHMVSDNEKKVEILTSVTENNKDNHTALIIQVTEVIGMPPSSDTDTTGVSNPDKFAAIVEDEIDELTAYGNNPAGRLAGESDMDEGEDPDTEFTVMPDFSKKQTAAPAQTASAMAPAAEDTQANDEKTDTAPAPTPAASAASDTVQPLRVPQTPDQTRQPMSRPSGKGSSKVIGLMVTALIIGGIATVGAIYGKDLIKRFFSTDPTENTGGKDSDVTDLTGDEDPITEPINESGEGADIRKIETTVNSPSTFKGQGTDVKDQTDGNTQEGDDLFKKKAEQLVNEGSEAGGEGKDAVNGGENPAPGNQGDTPVATEKPDDKTPASGNQGGKPDQTASGNTPEYE